MEGNNLFLLPLRARCIGLDPILYPQKFGFWTPKFRFLDLERVGFWTSNWMASAFRLLIFILVERITHASWIFIRIVNDSGAIVKAVLQTPLRERVRGAAASESGGVGGDFGRS